MKDSKCSNCGEKDLQSLIGSFAPHRRNLIPMLHSIQESAGYLTPDSMNAVARHLSVPVSDVYGTASFYALFDTKQAGQHQILLCDTPPCHTNGSKGVRKAIENELGIMPGETTQDRLFTLRLVSCFGLCNSAPAMMIDGDTYGNLTPDSIPGILASYREKEG